MAPRPAGNRNFGGVVDRLNFTAIDFETANHNRGSVCAVGLVKVVRGSITDTAHWLIRPPAGLDFFTPRNVAVHGIRPEQVVGAAEWASSLAQIEEIAAGDPYVAYNASFDSSVLRKANESAGIAGAAPEFFCALKLARRSLDLEKYRLPDVVAALGLSAFEHHHAGADAGACAEVVLALARRQDLPTFDDLWPVLPASRGGSAGRPVVKPARARAADLPQPHPQSQRAAGSSHPLAGQILCFTGRFASMDRLEAMERAASCGAVNGKSVTHKTTMLVRGTNDATARTARLDGTSAKDLKARDYINRGQQIRVLSEFEFLALLDWSPEPMRGAAASAVSRAQRAPRTMPSPATRPRRAPAVQPVPHEPQRSRSWVGLAATVLGRIGRAAGRRSNR